jgi:hypothetical protein
MPSPAALLAAALLAAALAALGGKTAADPGRLCDRAAAAAAAAVGVPLDVLRAIMLTESGVRYRGRWIGWPWAVNAAGSGRWHGDAGAALADIEASLAAGSRNVDVGCFQMNHRWHAWRFEGTAAMLDPAQNALNAARFLAELQAETGDWMRAAAAYHSRNPAFAEPYLARVAAHLARDRGGGDAAAALPSAAPPAARRGYPLFVMNGPVAGASLVPAAPGGAPLLGAAPGALFEGG